MNAIASSPGRVKLYLRLGRVSNLPTVWTNVLAGILLAGGNPEAPLLVPLLIALTLFYTGGMFLNDAFDHAYDREFRPERPIPSGQISLREVYAIGFGQMALGVVLLGVPAWWEGNVQRPEVFFAGIALAALITYYDLRHKVDPISPLIMALCRGMIYLIAAKAVGDVIGPSVFWGIMALLGYLIGLTYVAKQENLTEVKNLWPLAFLIAPFVYMAVQLLRTSQNVLLTGCMKIVFAAWVLYALSFLFGQKRSIPRCVISLIAGISLLDALLIAQASGSIVWTGVAALGFLLTLYFQRYIAGT